MRIKISGEEYILCEESSQRYYSNSKKGFFGSGIINSASDPCKVTRIGMLGELTISKFLGVPPDFSYIHNGDSQDFAFNGYTIDVKTAARDYGAALIRCRSEKGRYVFKPMDVYIAALIEEEDREKQFASVCIKGWATLDFVKKLPETPARVGKHMNYELKFGELQGIGRLKAYLKKPKKE